MAKENKTLTVAAPIAVALGLIQEPKAMNAQDAVNLVEAALPALMFLEEKMQGSVNHEADEHTIVRQNGGNVNGKSFSMTYKTQTKVSKAIKSCQDAIRAGKLIASVEASIETTATNADKKLSQDVPAK